MRRSLVVLALALSPLMARVASAQSDTTLKKKCVDSTGNPSTTGQASRTKDCPPPPPPPPPPPVATGVTSVSGILFFDVIQNGVLDTDEVGLSGWTVQLTGNGVSQTFSTLGDGSYSFSGMSAGTYTLCVLPPGGWIQTAPTSGPACGTGFGMTIVAPSSATDTTLTGINFGFISQ